MDISDRGFKPWQCYMRAFLDPEVSKYGDSTEKSAQN